MRSAVARPRIAPQEAVAAGRADLAVRDADNEALRRANAELSASRAVLRERDYQGVKNAIHELPGVRFTSGERLLAPDAGFARQVLPAVRTAMADQLDGTPGWSVLVTDAAHELTAPEIEFLRHALELCPVAVCALTKTDLYPHWRKIKQLDEGHLRNAGFDVRQ